MDQPVAQDTDPTPAFGTIRHVLSEPPLYTLASGDYVEFALPNGMVRVAMAMDSAWLVVSVMPYSRNSIQVVPL